MVAVIYIYALQGDIHCHIRETVWTIMVAVMYNKEIFIAI